MLLFFGQIRPLADPGRAKIAHGDPLLQETSSDQKATATNRMHVGYSFRYSNLVEIPQVRTTFYGKNSFHFGAAKLFFLNSLLTIYALNNKHNASGYACALQ